MANEKRPRGVGEYPSHQTERKLGVRFHPSPAAEYRGDLTVHANVKKLDAHLRDSGSMGFRGNRGEEADDGGGDEGKRALDHGASEPGAVVHQPRMTLDDKGKPQIREGHERFKAARDAGARVMPISVDRKSASKFHQAYGVGEPSLAVYHTELEEEAQGQPDR